MEKQKEASLIFMRANQNQTLSADMEEQAKSGEF